jgi:hypothetical protein
MPWSKSRPNGSGTSALYRSPEHKRARAALLAQHEDGDPCCLCGHGLYGPTKNFDADHLPGTNQYRGLAHGLTPCRTCGLRCNRVDGAKRGRARQSSSRLRW